MVSQKISILYQVIVLFLIFFLTGNTWSEERLRLATTTSTDNSGLLAELHPPFEEKFNVKVDVIAVGTGKALKLGQNGDVDVVMVHAPASEIKFIEGGFGIERLPVMHNDFVILGPKDDPAGLEDVLTVAEALKKLAASGSSFVSRGDDSGTHKKEISLWKSVDINPAGEWYLSAGQGMGAVLQIANDKLAYTLSDRGTYLAYKNKIDLVIVSEGDPALFNPYHVIIVNPEKHTHINLELAKKYVDYLRGKEGQNIIRDFKIGGELLFKPDVIK